MEPTPLNKPTLNSPPPPRHGRRRIAARWFFALWALVTLGLAAVKIAPVFSARENDYVLYFDRSPTGEIYSSGPLSPLSAAERWICQTTELLGQPIATYIQSRVAWNPERPPQPVIEAAMAGLARSQSPETLAGWRSSKFVERFTHPPIGPYRSFRIEVGVWILPVVGAVLAGVLYAFLVFADRRLATARRKKRMTAGLCGGCGYDRTSLNAASQCPECGAVP